MIKIGSRSLRRAMVVITIIYVGVQCWCTQKITMNIDEPMFGAYGHTILKLQGNKNVKEYDSKLPITAFNGIPRAVEQLFHPGLKKTGHEDFYNGRYISIIFSVLLGLLIFQWTKELYGESPAFFSFVFYLLCPNFLAHGIFVGTDVYASLFLTTSFYFLWKYLNQNKIRFFLLFSLSVAFAQISKFSMIFLFLLIPVLLLTRYFLRDKVHQHKNSFLKLLLIFVAINVFVISGAHLFYHMFVPLKDYSFRSGMFLQMQKYFGFLPVPLPSSYIQSMDAVIYFDSIGNGVSESISNPPYILGHYDPHGIWYYYFLTLFFKIPIATLLIWIGSSALLLKKSSKSSFIRNEFFLLLPVVFYLIYFDFFYATQLGIRHILIILPSLFIFSGSLYLWLITQQKKWIIYLLIAYQLISVASYFPHFLPYTNEFLLNKKMVYKTLGDTNIGYREGGKFLQSYLRKNPAAIFAPDSIIAGKIVLDANRVLALNTNRGEYTYQFIWAKDLVPVDHIHSQYLIYDITPRTADSLKKIYYQKIKTRTYPGLW
jgi:4-amino-4-deoxy-L-arabinose transferase-like glycosyltransferase